jgi:enoyl-CoA hydratase
MMGELVRIEKNGGIATVTIDNPPLNILNSKVTKKLGEVFEDLNHDPEVVVVILTGNGEKAFMAGADIREFPGWMEKGVRESSRVTQEVFGAIDNSPKPTIALLNGITLGGGCELSLTCDIRIAEEQTIIGLPEIKLGLFPGAGGTQRLPRLVGEAKAKEIMFKGEPLTAQEALSIGLVNQVVPKGSGLEAARKLAEKISSYSIQALSRIKRAVDEGMELTLEAGIRREAELFEEVFKTEDIKEGVQAFIQKRTPQFTHK